MLLLLYIGLTCLSLYLAGELLKLFADDYIVPLLIFQPPNNTKQKLLKNPRCFRIDHQNCWLHFQSEQPSNKDLSAKRAVVLLHGNACDIRDMQDMMQSIQEKYKCDVLCPEYPGYGDLFAAYPNLKSKDTIENLITFFNEEIVGVYDDVMIVGHSLGCYFGVEMAKQGFCKQLVLINPFYSLASLLNRKIGFGTSSYATHSPIAHQKSKDTRNITAFPLFGFIKSFNSAKAMKQINTRCQVKIFHAVDDSIIPYLEGEELSKLHKNSTFKLLQGDHNQLDINDVLNSVAFN